MVEKDSHGNFHGDDGRFVSLRDFIERIFSERESSAEFKRIALKEDLEAVKRISSARADRLEKRIDLLESGGAPFADRLNKGLVELKEDVEELNKNAVRTEVLNALRDQDEEAASNQKRQIQVALIVAGAGFIGVIVNIILVLSNG